MAVSIRNAAAAAVLTAVLAQPATAAPPPQQQLPILLDAQSSELNYGSNELVFRKVKIAQGTMSVAADQAHATGLDFEDSHWVFQGGVRIAMDQGQLSSDSADVTFAKKLLVKAIIEGKPAVFDQHDPRTGKPVQGHAEVIDYDVAKGIVRFTRNAWLSDGQNEIRGDSLKYIVAERKMVAEAAEQGAQRVHITITPPAAAGKP